MSNPFGNVDENATPIAGEESGLNRRRLLDAAVGGFALVASGLLVPGRLVEETEAADHPVRGIQRRKEQRRKRVRHEKRRRRTQGANNGSRAPGAIIDGIRWGLYSEAGAFEVEFWDSRNHYESRHVQNFEFVELRTNDTVGILWINKRYFFWAENIFGPLWVEIGYGGEWSTTRGWLDGTTVFSGYLKEYRLAPDMIVDGFKFTVERVPDDDDYKKPSLTIRKQ
jgi:hypothetical protein